MGQSNIKLKIILSQEIASYIYQYFSSKHYEYSYIDLSNNIYINKEITNCISISPHNSIQFRYKHIKKDTKIINDIPYYEFTNFLWKNLSLLQLQSILIDCKLLKKKRYKQTLLNIKDFRKKYSL